MDELDTPYIRVSFNSESFFLLFSISARFFLGIEWLCVRLFGVFLRRCPLEPSSCRCPRRRHRRRRHRPAAPGPRVNSWYADKIAYFLHVSSRVFCGESTPVSDCTFSSCFHHISRENTASRRSPMRTSSLFARSNRAVSPM